MTQVGTLKELDVKPGDVVEMVTNVEACCIGETCDIEEGGRARSRDGGFYDPDLDGEFNRTYRLISRATPPLTIEVGKYYKTRDGRKAEVHEECDDGLFVCSVGCLVGDWSGNGVKTKDLPILDLIAEWTDTPADDTPKTWGEMTDAEKGALLLGVNRGQEIQYAYADDMIWRGNHNGFTFNDGDHYRIKQQPKVETVTIMVHDTGESGFPYISANMSDPTHQLTYTRTNGAPDLDSITMEKL